MAQIGQKISQAIFGAIPVPMMLQEDSNALPDIGESNTICLAQ